MSIKTKIAIVLENDTGAELHRIEDEVSDLDDVTKVVIYLIQKEDWAIGVGATLRIVARNS